MYSQYFILISTFVSCYNVIYSLFISSHCVTDIEVEADVHGVKPLAYIDG